MIKTVECVTKGCELEDRIVTTTALFMSRIAPLDGPFICPKCGKPMKIVERIPANKGKSGETMPRSSSSSRPTGIKVGKRKVKKGIKIKVGRGTLGTRFKKPPTKVGPKKPGPRKRGPSK
jgi:hypothetical protein